MGSLEKETQQKLYRTMVRIRAFEEKALELFDKSLTPGRMHPYIGEEAVAAGSCAAIRGTDSIVSTHRGGGHLVAKGAEMRKLFAEYMGRATGYGYGKGGPMHISIPEIGVLCTNGIVGGGIPVAVGAALACKMQYQDSVILCFFGDGAANTGAFHESLNLASIWKLPVVFVCENNQYAETMPFSKAFATTNIAERSIGYGFTGLQVDGNLVETVYGEVTKAAERARNGKGPSLIEAKTYRIGQHFSGESNHYRQREEIEAWSRRDPISAYRAELLAGSRFTESELDEVEKNAKAEVQIASEQAISDPFPPQESLLQDVAVSYE